jgi:hypothetical protein
MTKVCTRAPQSWGRDNFTITGRNGSDQSFLCAGGLNQHWDIPETAQIIEVRLSTEEPESPESHKFHFSGFDLDPTLSINIDPDGNEAWDSEWHDTYEAFDKFTTRFVKKAKQRHGWMEIFIAE